LDDVASGDIDQPQCHTSVQKTKKPCEREKKAACNIVVGQCHPSATQPTKWVVWRKLFILLSNIWICSKY